MRAPPEDPSDYFSCDPLSTFFPASGGHPDPESAFVASALAFLESQGAEPDPEFRALFWQTLRVRLIAYRYVTQRPLTPGLSWFMRFYHRIEEGRHGLTAGHLVYAAAKGDGWSEGLRSLEVRTSPWASESTLAGWLFEVAEAVEALEASLPVVSGPRPEFGVVFHLLRERGGAFSEGRPASHGQGTHADPARSPTGYRYGGFYAKSRKDALALSRVLLTYPRLLSVVRGIDVAADEGGVPTWVLAPLFRHLRAVGRSASRRMLEGEGKTVPAFRASAHAGEDFAHVTSGLRRIDECLRHFGMSAGDRLGHALALGVDPHAWARRQARVPMAREERLWDLVWEWTQYARGFANAPAGRAEHVRHEVERLAQEVFARSMTPLECARLADALHDPVVLHEAGFPGGAAPPPERHARVHEYLTSVEIFARGQVVEEVDLAPEVEAIQALQRAMRGRVGSAGLTVELNPTSNLLIGHLGDVAENPLWRLQPLRPEPGLVPISVTLGADDPLIFATRIREEYQLVYDTLLLGGVSDEEARRWLDRARASGLEARFTLPSRPGDLLPERLRDHIVFRSPGGEPLLLP